MVTLNEITEVCKKLELGLVIFVRKRRIIVDNVECRGGRNNTDRERECPVDVIPLSILLKKVPEGFRVRGSVSRRSLIALILLKFLVFLEWVILFPPTLSPVDIISLLYEKSVEVSFSVSTLFPSSQCRTFVNLSDNQRG